MAIRSTSGSYDKPNAMSAGACSPQPLLSILLVDDDHDDLALFGMAVTKSGLNIWLHTALGAEEGIAYLEGKGKYADRAMHPLPDLLVLDLVMAGMDGFGFLAWRRSRPELWKLPVVALSGLGSPRHIEHALALGAGAHLAKPSSFEGWVDLVRLLWDLGVKHAR